MKRLSLSLLPIFLLCVFCAPKSPATEDFGRVAQYAELLEWLADTQTQTIVVDIRTERETASGMIPGARHIPLAELESRVRELPREARIVLYCQSGRRVQSALAIFKEEGYAQVYNFISISNWKGQLEQPR